MQIVEKIEKVIKFSESSSPKTLIICGVIIFIFGSLKLFEVIINGESESIIQLYITVTLTGIIIAGVALCKPTILDNIFTNTTKTYYETNVDKSKYELSVITNNNEKYLKFDNKDNDNIQLRNNDKKINSDIFKIVAENDNEYLLEYEVVDKGFFTDTVSTERSSLTKQ